MHSFIHFLPSTDKEAYTDAVSPLLKSNSSTISTYSYACWGSQIGNVVADSVLLPLFKFQSMSSGILFCNGGPLGWLGERQTRTSLSLCEAKIHATCATSKKVVDFYNLCPSMGESGHTLHNMDTSTPIYNDNEACIRWSHSMITNGTRENSVHEWVQDNMVSVKHMSGKVNPTDIFTKEMKDIFSGFGTLLCLVFLILTTPLYSQSMSITPGNSLHRAYFQLQHELLSSPVPPHTSRHSSGLLSVIPKP